jgi:hypothetical protein
MSFWVDFLTAAGAAGLLLLLQAETLKTRPADRATAVAILTELRDKAGPSLEKCEQSGL